MTSATETPSSASAKLPPPLLAALVSGGIAGTAVDVSLFPLDTIKTRLQSSQGFWKAGGFRSIYAGLGAAAVGSAPGAALFFLTYEGVKGALSKNSGIDDFHEHPMVHMGAASCGEVSACLVRVPVEIVKQRRQANSKGASTMEIVRGVAGKEGLRGFYRGYLTTVLREIPFSLIQFPLWEQLKVQWRKRLNGGVEINPLQSAICGAFAGGFAAAVTTPLDVAKTRIMLAEAESEMAKRASMTYALKTVYGDRGFGGLYAGVVPRTIWITIGGAVFFGAYETMISVITKL